MDKYEIAQILREIGFVIELTEPNPKKAIAYRRAAYSVESIPDLNKSIQENELEKFSGIGKEISRMIKTLHKRNRLPYHDELIKRVPQSIFELNLIPSLRPNRIRSLYEKTQISSLDALENALKKDKLGKIIGFYPSYNKKLAQRIKEYRKHGVTLLYSSALHIAESFLEILKEHVDHIEISGQLRRKLEIVNEIDCVIITSGKKKLIDFLKHHYLIRSVHENENHIKLLTKPGIVINLFLAESKQDFPLQQLLVTGNEKHLNDLNKEYKKAKKKLDGIFEDEEEIYKKVNLSYILPELREGYGEIEAVKGGKKFDLVTLSDLRGTFHCHTNYSDGVNTIQEMAEAVRNLGWEYIGITDHSKACSIANGMDEERLFLQLEEIKKLNAAYGKDFHIFSGIECDILKDGSLDFSPEILKQLDFVIISIHRFFSMEKDEMTARLIKAIENPLTTMVGHLSGRLLRHRDPYQFDIDKVLDAAAANHKIIEINASPNRLDMDWRYWIKAKQMGIKCSINPDAHSTYELLYCQYGVNMARKGWLEKSDVINTMSLKEMKKFLQNAKR